MLGIPKLFIHSLAHVGRAKGRGFSLPISLFNCIQITNSWCKGDSLQEEIGLNQKSMRHDIFHTMDSLTLLYDLSVECECMCGDFDVLGSEFKELP